MISPAAPIDEKSRLEALYSYDILDSIPEKEYDSITKLASAICGTPISIITIVDEERQWFKSNLGLGGTSAPRELGFCSHTILDTEKPLVVKNALEDERFKDNPFVTGPAKLEFYAGVPLVTGEGHALGTLCVLDNNPREITSEQLEALDILATQIVQLLELRKSNQELSNSKKELKESFDNLNDFANIVAHDIQAPVRNMGLFADIIIDEYKDLIDDEGKKVLGLLSENAIHAREYIKGVLQYSKATHQIQLDKETVDLNAFFSKLIRTTVVPEHITIKISEDLPSILISKIALQQVLTNLLSNAIKYSNKENGLIEIDAIEKKSSVHISIKDNGRGIPKNLLSKIFDIFYMVDKDDALNKGSYGIGLSIVNKVVAKMGGSLSVDSSEGEGSTFTVSFPHPKKD
ncbi:sensor histidine kinase [Dokdonia sp. Hel_I_53]|uniref:sensor histidine kinase n=1 Tax=Dokdonia sp. Hel_I_53 TaxID=1566287 RepID=UPI00119ADF49|nr:GAF domain-containing sensor histidine kinase [Dokdonia sp. Hel_I_53]TVZ53036.1 hypothetical protein OD90_2227 [Dokdonia sp. Hel_I_53]